MLGRRCLKDTTLLPGFALGHSSVVVGTISGLRMVFEQVGHLELFCEEIVLMICLQKSLV